MAVSLLQLFGGSGNAPVPALGVQGSVLPKGQNATADLLPEGGIADGLPLSFMELLAQHKQTMLAAPVNKEKNVSTEGAAALQLTAQDTLSAEEENYFQQVVSLLKQTLEESELPVNVGEMPAITVPDAADAQLLAAQETLREMWQQHYGDASQDIGQYAPPASAVQGAVVFAPLNAPSLPQENEIKAEDIVAGYAEVPILPLVQPLGAQAEEAVESEPIVAEIILQDTPLPLRYTAPPPPRPVAFYMQDNAAITTPDTAPMQLTPSLPPLSEGSEGEQQPPVIALLASHAKANDAAKAITLPSMVQDSATAVNQPAFMSLINEVTTDNAGTDTKADTLTVAGTQELSSSSSSKDTPLIRLHAQDQRLDRFSMSEQMAVHIRQLHATNKKGQLSVQLHPAELGRVEIRLSSQEDGTMLVRVMTELRDTYELLRHDKATLERILQDSGLQMEHGSLEFAHHQREQQEHGSEQHGGLPSVSTSDAERISQEQAAQEREDSSTLTWVATTGINIRV